MKLEGIKVLDLSQVLPGPHLTKRMADHGADVIRIEPPSSGPTRHIGAMQGDRVFGSGIPIAPQTCSTSKEVRAVGIQRDW